MKKVILVFSLLCASFGFGQSMGSWKNDGPKYVWFTPCGSWMSDAQGGYKCSYLGWQVRMYEMNEVDQLINSLQQKINELERRVQSLEQPR